MKNKINDQIFSDIDYKIYALHWHGDRILLPKSAQLLASSDRCKEQMFKIGRNAYGLQFHIEVDFNDVERWIVEDIDFVQNALGEEGSTLLGNQNIKYCESSKDNRLQLIRNIFKSFII